MSKSKPRLLYTEDYGIFKSHEFNRDIHENPILEASMREHGFMPSSAIQCVEDGGGKLKVIRGHHRLHYAKKLRIGVWYIIDDSVTDPHPLEGSSTSRWTVSDFAGARAKGGDRACCALVKFSRDHSIGVSIAARLMHRGGQAHTSIKLGTFNTGNADQAARIASVTDKLLESGIAHAASSTFVRALHLAILTPDFDLGRFTRKLDSQPSLLRKRSTMEEYLEEIERVYNHHNKKPMPVRIAALEARKVRLTESGRNLGSTGCGAAARWHGPKERKHREAQCAD